MSIAVDSVRGMAPPPRWQATLDASDEDARPTVRLFYKG
jgi:hypothetical protein